MWLYDSLWRLLLRSRQGPVEERGKQENGFLYLQVSGEQVLRHKELRQLPERPDGHVRLVLVSDSWRNQGYVTRASVDEDDESYGVSPSDCDIFSVI